jgi:hypothetical protein
VGWERRLSERNRVAVTSEGVGGWWKGNDGYYGLGNAGGRREKDEGTAKRAHRDLNRFLVFFLA